VDFVKLLPHRTTKPRRLSSDKTSYLFK
jgi:hypothetical protein